MTTPVELVTVTVPIEELAQRFDRSGHHGFPVVAARLDATTAQLALPVPAEAGARSP